MYEELNFKSYNEVKKNDVRRSSWYSRKERDNGNNRHRKDLNLMLFLLWDDNSVGGIICH